jgi:hypothetical protein
MLFVLRESGVVGEGTVGVVSDCIVVDILRWLLVSAFGVVVVDEVVLG